MTSLACHRKSCYTLNWHDVAHGAMMSPERNGYLDQFEGEAFMEDAVDLRPSRQLVGVHLIPGPFDPLLKVHRELLHHPAVNVQHWLYPTDI